MKEIPHLSRWIVFIGNQSVGKSKLIQQLMGLPYDNKINHTLGFEISTQTIDHVKETYYEIAGNFERTGADLISSIVNYELTAKVIYCFDITNRQSLADLKEWHGKVKQASESKLLENHPDIIIVATKVDKDEQHHLTDEEIKAGLENAGLDGRQVIYTSAKTANNLNQVRLAIGLYTANQINEIESIKEQVKAYKYYTKNNNPKLGLFHNKKPMMHGQAGVKRADAILQAIKNHKSFDEIKAIVETAYSASPCRGRSLSRYLYAAVNKEIADSVNVFAISEEGFGTLKQQGLWSGEQQKSADSQNHCNMF